MNRCQKIKKLVKHGFKNAVKKPLLKKAACLNNGSQL
jgi:hypothetical protein